MQNNVSNNEKLMKSINSHLEWLPKTKKIPSIQNAANAVCIHLRHVTSALRATVAVIKYKNRKNLNCSSLLMLMTYE